MTKPIKVSVHLTVTVDPDIWTLEYGQGPDIASVRADVKGYVLDQVQQSSAGESGAIVRVEEKG